MGLDFMRKKIIAIVLYSLFLCQLLTIESAPTSLSEYYFSGRQESNSDNMTNNDTDGDGWNNSIELLCGSSIEDNKSTPLDFDFDGDKICDNEDEDDDNDGASDLEEIACGTDQFNSSFSPSMVDFDDDGSCAGRDSDSDGDGWTDEWEIACGSDPEDSGFRPLDRDNDGFCSIWDKDDFPNRVTSNSRSRLPLAEAESEIPLINRAVSLVLHPITLFVILGLMLVSFFYRPLFKRF